MKYIKRSIEDKFLQMNSFFKAVLVTGARQTGKTTMLKNLAKDENRTYVTLDDLVVRELAKSDPALFFQMYKPPIIIDEVQYAPELFSQIKIICDNSEQTGLFWLTGSQQFSMMKNVRESLAGRIGILDLFSFSLSEINDVHYENTLDFTLECLTERQHIAPTVDVHDIFDFIWRGGMPGVREANENMRNEYFKAYVDTYIMRDVSELGGITDSLKFRKFLVATASLISEQVNYKNLADTADISQPTAKEWLKLLEGMGIIYLLKPYANNHLKRLTKTPKLYFKDTGLAAYLSMWLSKDTLLNGAASGHYFENFVVCELLRNYSYGSQAYELYYYRDSNAKEIDVLVEMNGKIHPIEIKKSATPDRREVNKFDILSKANAEISSGGIICMSENIVPINQGNSYIPCRLI